MAFKIRKVEELAEDEGKTVKATLAWLAKMGVPVIDQFYDQGALDAIAKEPKTSNIGKAVKNAFTLAPTDGVGAMKACADLVDLDITRHHTRRTHYLTLRNKKGHRRICKVYTTARAATDAAVSTFNLRGFLDPKEVASHFLFVCYDGPVMWALSRKQLAALHKVAKEKAASTDIARIPKRFRSHKTGALTLYLDPGIEKYVLSSAAQLSL